MTTGAAIFLALFLAAGAQIPHVLARLRLTSNPSQLDNLTLRETETWIPSDPQHPDETAVNRITFFHAFPLAMTQTENGRSFNSSASARQQKQNQVEKSRILNANLAPADIGETLDLNGEFWTLQRLEAQFDWTLFAADPPGRIEVQFTPHPGHHPGTWIAKVLAISAGILDVDPVTGQLLGGRFHNTRALNYGGGLLAHIAGFDGYFTMQQINGCWVTKEIVVHIRGRELLHDASGTETIAYRRWNDVSATGSVH